ncbi:hypothetical protein HK405_003063 [Cladochytrium tenue]|nr:hypothetical protein HK405_003063 [Cladochytrium tenue]
MPSDEGDAAAAAGTAASVAATASTVAAPSAALRVALVPWPALRAALDPHASHAATATTASDFVDGFWGLGGPLRVRGAVIVRGLLAPALVHDGTTAVDSTVAAAEEPFDTVASVAVTLRGTLRAANGDAPSSSAAAAEPPTAAASGAGEMVVVDVGPFECYAVPWDGTTLSSAAAAAASAPAPTAEPTSSFSRSSPSPSPQPHNEQELELPNPPPGCVVVPFCIDLSHVDVGGGGGGAGVTPDAAMRAHAAAAAAADHWHHHPGDSNHHHHYNQQDHSRHTRHRHAHQTQHNHHHHHLIASLAASAPESGFGARVHYELSASVVVARVYPSAADTPSSTSSWLGPAAAPTSTADAVARVAALRLSAASTSGADDVGADPLTVPGWLARTASAARRTAALTTWARRASAAAPVVLVRFSPAAVLRELRLTTADDGGGGESVDEPAGAPPPFRPREAHVWTVEAVAASRRHVVANFGYHDAFLVFEAPAAAESSTPAGGLTEPTIATTPTPAPAADWPIRFALDGAAAAAGDAAGAAEELWGLGFHYPKACLHGRFLFTTSSRRSVLLMWDVASGQLLRRLDQARGPEVGPLRQHEVVTEVSSIQMTPDATSLLVAVFGGTLYEWRVATGDNSGGDGEDDGGGDGGGRGVGSALVARVPAASPQGARVPAASAAASPASAYAERLQRSRAALGPWAGSRLRQFKDAAAGPSSSI